MANYNKFAVAASDLKGKWTSNYTGLTQYVNANTGASAGADTHASNQNFEFNAANSYKWDISVASGFVGNIKFQNAKSNGKFSMNGNWQINFSDIEGKPKNTMLISPASKVPAFYGCRIPDMGIIQGLVKVNKTINT